MADKTSKKKRDDTGGKGLQAYSAGPKKRDEGGKGNQAYDVVAGPGGKGNLAYPVKGKVKK